MSTGGGGGGSGESTADVAIVGQGSHDYRGVGIYSVRPRAVVCTRGRVGCRRRLRGAACCCVPGPIPHACLVPLALRLKVEAAEAARAGTFLGWLFPRPIVYGGNAGPGEPDTPDRRRQGSSPAPQEFRCGLSGDVMADPVIAQCSLPRALIDVSPLVRP